MRIGSGSAGAKPVPVDRNPTNRTQSSSQSGIAPHGSTTRWTYTVPAGSNAVIQTSTVFVQRVTAATTAAIAQSSVTYAPLGVSSATVHTAIITTNGVNDFQVNTQGVLGDLIATDVVTGLDVDTSTAGTVTFTTAVKIFEYPK